MARFEGTFEEFNKHHGPNIRNLVAIMTKSEKNTLGNRCQRCGKTFSSLDAAHKHGMERKNLMRKALEKYSKGDNWHVVDDLDKLFNEIKELHMPIVDVFMFLCKDCHKEYDEFVKQYTFNSKKSPKSSILSSNNTPENPGRYEGVSKPPSRECEIVTNNWEYKMGWTTMQNRKNIEKLISAIDSKFGSDSYPLAVKSWYYHYCMHNNCQFSGIICHKKNSEIRFRICRDSFDIKDNRVRKPNRWFFSEGQERSIDILEENFDLILQCLKHAYDCTSTMGMKSPRNGIELADKKDPCLSLHLSEKQKNLIPKCGDIFTEEKLHKEFAVENTGGIRPSTPNKCIVLITTVPKIPTLEQYSDTVDENHEYLTYTGSGLGDQKITNRNKAILESHNAGRMMLYFIKRQQNHLEYQFRVCYDSHYWDTERNSNGADRKVIRFKLRICDD